MRILNKRRLLNVLGGVALVFLLIFGCKTSPMVSSITTSESLDNIEILGDEAERAFVEGYIKAALVQPGDSMVIKAVRGSQVKIWKLYYPEPGFGRSHYLHHPFTSGFYIAWSAYHTYYNYCGPLNETHTFLDPLRNYHPGGPWPLEHLRQHQRVWHDTYDPLDPSLGILGLWDDFTTSTPNLPK